MKKNYLPCYQYPTNTILIDDNKNFLRTLEAALGNQFKCRAFEDPKQALKYIAETTRQLGTVIKRYIPEAAEDTETHEKSLLINLSDIHKEIYNPDRFKEIAVIVVDYGMPSMNGLEICEKIRQMVDTPVKIIMLTGEAGYETAVKGFNDGSIDKFILKSKTNYVNEVLESIHFLQEQYFVDLSAPIYRSLQVAAQKLCQEKSFIDLVHTVKKENKSTEFYILDDSFSLLLLDEQGKNPVWLIIKTEEDMGMQYELASGDKRVARDKVTVLENRQKLAYFPEPKGINESAQNWKLIDAKPVGDKNSGYYYAIAKGKDTFPLDIKNIASYHDYLKIK